MKICVKLMLGCVLSLALVGATAGTTAVYADAGKEAKVGSVEYDTLDSALEAWQDNTVLTLLKDISDHPTISVSGNKTLDLNGMKLDGINGEGGGSVLRVTGGQLTVTDSSAGKNGTITGGYAVSGGGIYVENATLRLTGGSVEGNRANYGGGVYAVNSTVEFSAGTVRNNNAIYGGGVYLSGGSFAMAQGSTAQIAGNTATVSGGGLYASGTEAGAATVTLAAGKIAENTAAHGGGAHIGAYATLNLSAGAEIVSNSAKGGAGVYLRGISDEQKKGTAVLSMTGGTVSKNTSIVDEFATSELARSESFGGGVKVASAGFFQMTGGIVTENTTTFGGGGASVEYGGKAQFGGNAQVYGNSRGGNTDNVFFADEESITIDGGFTGRLGFNHALGGKIATAYSGSLENISADDADFEVYLEGGALLLGNVTPVSLRVKTQPDKLVYHKGENFAKDGMTVEVTLKDGRKMEVSDYVVENGNALDGTVMSVIISYTAKNVTVTTSVAISYAGSGSSAESISYPFVAVAVAASLFVVALIVIGALTDKSKRKKS